MSRPHGPSGASRSPARPPESAGAAPRRHAIPGWSLVLLGGFTLVVAVLYVAQAVLMPFALAVLFTFFLAPIVALLQKLGLGRVLSVIIVTLFMLGIIGGVAYVVGTQVVSLGHELPQYRSNIRQKIADVRWFGRDSSIQKVQETVKGAVEDATKPEGTKTAPPTATHVIVDEPPANQLRRNLVALGEWMQPVGIAALVLVLVPFMLLERQEMRNRIIRLIGYSKLAITTKALDEAGERVSRYLLMQTIINTTFGVAVTVGLLVIGVPYALLFGFLGGRCGWRDVVQVARVAGKEGEDLGVELGGAFDHGQVAALVYEGNLGPVHAPGPHAYRLRIYYLVLLPGDDEQGDLDDPGLPGEPAAGDLTPPDA